MGAATLYTKDENIRQVTNISLSYGILLQQERLIFHHLTWVFFNNPRPPEKRLNK